MLDMDERLRQVVVRGHLVVDAAEQARAVRALNSDILGKIDIDSAENRGDAYRYLFVICASLRSTSRPPRIAKQ